MLVHVLRLPLSLDPLIAEAKRRARARRFLLLAAAAVAVGGAAAAAVALRSSERSPPAIVAAPTCRSAQLHLVPGRGGAATGIAMRDFALVNVSDTSCSLRGWPALQLVLGNERLITPYVVQGHYGANGLFPARTIRLGQGGAASFRIAGSDGTGTGIQTCRAVRALLVTPSGFGKPLSVPHGIGLYCAPYRLLELPLVSGPTDQHRGF